MGMPGRIIIKRKMLLILQRKGENNTMASIVKRKKKFSVVYTYTDENGVKRQRWETFDTNAEAKKRKTQVEFQQNTGTFIPPVAKTFERASRRIYVDLWSKYMGDVYIRR